MRECMSLLVVMLFCVVMLLVFIGAQIGLIRENYLNTNKEVIYVYTE